MLIGSLSICLIYVMGFPKGKGLRKRRSSCFQHSHSACNKEGLAQVYTSSSESETDESSTPVKTRRLTHQEFERTFEVTGEGNFVPSAQRRLPTSPECSSPYVLRPKGVEKNIWKRKKKINNLVATLRFTYPQW